MQILHDGRGSIADSYIRLSLPRVSRHQDGFRKCKTLGTAGNKSVVRAAAVPVYLCNEVALIVAASQPDGVSGLIGCACRKPLKYL